MPDVLDSALISLDEAKDELRKSDTAHDGLISSLVSEMSATISTFCDRCFTQQQFTEIHSGDGNRSLWVRNAWPIVVNATTGALGAGEGVTYSPLGQFSTSSFALLQQYDGQVGNYAVDANGAESGQGRLIYISGLWPVQRLNSAWPYGMNNLKVIYTGGYAAGSIPDPIRRACRRLVATAFEIAVKGHNAYKSQGFPGGQGNVSVIEHDIPPDVRRLLEPWRKKRFA